MIVRLQVAVVRDTLFYDLDMPFAPREGMWIDAPGFDEGDNPYECRNPMRWNPKQRVLEICLNNDYIDKHPLDPSNPTYQLLVKEGWRLISKDDRCIFGLPASTLLDCYSEAGRRKALSCFDKLGIRTVADVIKTPVEKFGTVPGFGISSVNRLRERLLEDRLDFETGYPYGPNRTRA